VWKNLLGGLLDGVIEGSRTKKKTCVHRRVIEWQAWSVGGGFAFHIMLSRALRQEDAPSLYLLDRRQNASSDSIPPSSVYYKRLMHARCRCQLFRVNQAAQRHPVEHVMSS
jgi:hypothetical protein